MTWTIVSIVDFEQVNISWVKWKNMRWMFYYTFLKFEKTFKPNERLLAEIHNDDTNTWMIGFFYIIYWR